VELTLFHSAHLTGEMNRQRVHMSEKQKR
jgi:hypothetical protein